VKDRVQSIERGIDILMALAHGPKTLAEVTRATGLSKATAFRILGSLGYENLVVKNNSHSYTLGPGCLRLIQGATQGDGAITAVAGPALDALWKATEETVALHIRVGLERICVEEIPGPQPIRYVSTVGASAPLTIGSAGRVLLAYTASSEFESVLTAILRADAGTHSADEAWLRDELDTIRRRGYALSAGERVHGAAAISVPIHGRHGFVAALSVLGPDFRLNKRRRLEMLPQLLQAAAQIGDILGESRGASDAVKAV